MTSEEIKILFSKHFPSVDMGNLDYNYPFLLAIAAFERGIEEGIEEGIKVGADKQKLKTAYVLDSLLNPF